MAILKKHEDKCFLAAFVRLWSFATISRNLTPPGVELRYNFPVAFFAFVSFLFPLQPIALILGFGVRVVACLASVPYVHDAQHWCNQTDVAFLFALIGLVWQKEKTSKTRNFLRMMTSRITYDQAESLIKNAAATIRIQLIMLYFGAALWKFNEGFMHPKFSCAVRAFYLATFPF